MSKKVDLQWVLEQLYKDRESARGRADNAPIGSQERAQANGEAIGLAVSIAYVGGLINMREIKQEVSA